MENEWYMAIGGNKVGPVSIDQIIANIRDGSLRPEVPAPRR